MEEWKNGRMEEWEMRSDLIPNTPVLHHSNTPIETYG